MHKKIIMKKTAQVAVITLISRFLGLARDLLMGRILGSTFLADAFVTAYKIPNSLRKIFAEGALSAAVVPVMVKTYTQEEEKKAVSSLMSASFLVFEGLLLLLCILIFVKAEAVVRLIAPGWFTFVMPPIAPGIAGKIAYGFQWLHMLIAPTAYGVQAGPQVAQAVLFLRILIAFIMFISSSALLASALNSVNHFFIPAVSPVLLNIVFIAGLVTCWWFAISIQYLCWFILLGGLLQFFLHVAYYFWLGFSFSPITSSAWKSMRLVMRKFVPCVLSMSVMEINLFIDTSLASFLPAGSMLLIYLGNRFVGIPLGVFAVAFSTILLPHFSRVSLRSPRRLRFYLLEATKFVVWVTIPLTLFLCFWADKIYYTLFLSEKFPESSVIEAAHVLIAFAIGLAFFSLNKILLNLYYALHETRIPMIISVVTTVLNFIINLLLLQALQATGLALATTIAGGVQAILFIWYLHKRFGLSLHRARFNSFLINYTQQLLVAIPLFLGVYYFLIFLIGFLPPTLGSLLLNKVLFWFWAGPLAVGVLGGLFLTRRAFNVRLFFLD